MLRLLDIDLDPLAGVHALAEEGGSDAKAGAAIDRIAHRVHAQRHAPAINLRRAGDEVEPRLQWIESLDEGFRIGTDAGKFLYCRQHVERGRVAVRVFA